SSSTGPTPLAASARRDASSTRSSSFSPVPITRRSRIPVRVRIHSSLVSTRASSSAFGTRRAGTAEPTPSTLTAITPPWIERSGPGGVGGAKRERHVRTAEPVGVRQRDGERRLACDVRHVVEVALGVRLLVVDRRRDRPVSQREYRVHRLDPARAAEQV